jgi:hypothetical protein
VLLRQSLVGGNYGLLRDRFWDKNLTEDALVPNVDYFSAVLFKRHMGNQVFATAPASSAKVLAYAHCAREYDCGLAIAIINFDAQERAAWLLQTSSSSDELSGRHIDYIMTADGGEGGSAFSQFTKLNSGKRLVEAKDLVGASANGNALVLLAQSYGVVVFPNASLRLCAVAPTSASLLPPALKIDDDDEQLAGKSYANDEADVTVGVQDPSTLPLHVVCRRPPLTTHSGFVPLTIHSGFPPLTIHSGFPHHIYTKFAPNLLAAPLSLNKAT